MRAHLLQVPFRTPFVLLLVLVTTAAFSFFSPSSHATHTTHTHLSLTLTLTLTLTLALRSCLLAALKFNPSCPLCRTKLEDPSKFKYSVNIVLLNVLEKHFKEAYEEREKEEEEEEAELEQIENLKQVSGVQADLEGKKKGRRASERRLLDLTWEGGRKKL